MNNANAYFITHVHQAVLYIFAIQSLWNQSQEHLE